MELIVEVGDDDNFVELDLSTPFQEDRLCLYVDVLVHVLFGLSQFLQAKGRPGEFYGERASLTWNKKLGGSRMHKVGCAGTNYELSAWRS